MLLPEPRPRPPTPEEMLNALDRSEAEIDRLASQRPAVSVDESRGLSGAARYLLHRIRRPLTLLLMRAGRR